MLPSSVEVMEIMADDVEPCSSDDDRASSDSLMLMKIPETELRSDAMQLVNVCGSDPQPEIIQTRRGEILIYRGHRYSKISLGGQRKYWRCTQRPCKAKIHTHIHTGAVLHISDGHDHAAPVERTVKDRIMERLDRANFIYCNN